MTSLLSDIAIGGGSYILGAIKWIISKIFSHKEKKLSYKLAKEHKYFADIQKARKMTDNSTSWTRRLIALIAVSVGFGGILICSLANIPVYVPIHHASGFFSSLFSHTSISYTQIQGFVMTDDFWHILYMIFGFYFGTMGLK